MEYGNHLKHVGRAALAGAVIGLLAVLGAVVGITVKGEWASFRPDGLLLVFLVPVVALAAVVGLTACFRVRVRGGAVQHVFLGRFVLREGSLREFERVELGATPRVRFAGGRKMRLLGMHLDELGRMAGDLTVLRDAARRSSPCGHPPRAVAVDPAWLEWEGGTVPKLAESIAGESAFERLPILADALEDAGCTDAHLLGHLRGPGPHAPGCWALDLLTGKE
jgi:hypothetical protein